MQKVASSPFPIGKELITLLKPQDTIQPMLKISFLTGLSAETILVDPVKRETPDSNLSEQSKFNIKTSMREDWSNKGWVSKK